MTQAILASGFNGVQFEEITRNREPWIRSTQLAQALGYKDESSVRKIFERHSDEFSPSMTDTVKLTLSGNLTTETRIFSLRGCHLIAMFSRTPIAKEFRVWVLNVLENLNKTTLPTPEPLQLPLPVLSTAADCAPLRDLVHAWSQIAGLPHASLWAQVKAHFQLSRLDDLPLDWIPDALAFVQSKIDAVQGTIASAALPVLPAPEPTYEEKVEAVRQRMQKAYVEFYEAAWDLTGILRDPYWGKNVPEHAREFGNAMNYGIQALAMTVQQGAHALDLYCRAHVEGLRCLRA